MVCCLKYIINVNRSVNNSSFIHFLLLRQKSTPPYIIYITTHIVLPQSIQNLVTALKLLPGIGERNAMRLALHLINQPNSTREQIGSAIIKVTDNLHKCRDCRHFAAAELCPICLHPQRQKSLICIVEDSLDLLAIEATNAYQGVYHVLGGALDPLNGVGPNELNIASLNKRLETTQPVEIILATNPTVEGDATATYIQNMLKDYQNVTVSTLARGLPMGSDMEYVGAITLKKALQERQ